MTLCIAAACRFQGNPAMVFCSDTRSLSSSRDWGLTISSENADKERYVGEFTALVAGTPTKADELLGHWNAAIRKFSALAEGPDSDLYMNALFEDLRVGSRIHKKQIQDHFLGMGSPFKGIDDFLARGRSSLPEEQFKQLWEELRSHHLGAEVILGGFHGDEAVMIKVDMNGEPHWEDQYSVIGTGSAEALAFLAQNEFDEQEIQLQDCLMRVLEALEFASTANNTVGQSKRFTVRIKGREECDVKMEFFDLMKSKVRLAKTVDLGDVGHFLDDEDDAKTAPTKADMGVVMSLTNPNGSDALGEL